MKARPNLTKDNLSFSLFLTDRFYDGAVQMLIEHEMFLTDFLRSTWPDIYLKSSEVDMDDLGCFTFIYLFELDDEDVHISCPIGQSLSTAYVKEHKASFRDLSQLLEFIHATI